MVKVFGKYSIDKTGKDIATLLEDMFISFGFGNSDRFIDDDIGLGIGHLKIPSMDRKSIASDDDVIVCFSGEIFDYEDDSEGSDVEDYILREYNAHGMDFVKGLNGVFVIIIYDKIAKSLFIVNDRYGMKPLFYHADKKGIVFASEIKAVISDVSIPRAIDWDFWKDFFSYGYSLGTKTPFKDIHSLPNATILEYHEGSHGHDGNHVSNREGKVSLHRYWDYDKIKINHKRTKEETIAEGVEVLKNVMQRQTKGLKECMVFLSGGYDSRMIAAGIKQYSDIKDIDINAFTIPKNDVGKDTFKDKDVKYASVVSRILGIKHTIVGSEHDYFNKYMQKFVYEHDGLGFENMWMMPLIGSLDESTKLVNFDGIAGDVFLKAGYLLKPSVSYHDDLSNTKMARKLEDEKLSIIIGEKLLSFSNVNIFDVAPFFKDDVVGMKDLLKPNFDSIYNELRALSDSENRIKIFQAKNRTKNIICLQPSNLIMRKTYSRMPFCDNEFVEFAFSIPIEMKLRHDIYRKILDKAFPQLKDAPTTNDTVHLKDRFKKMLIRNKLDFIRYSLEIFKSIKSKPKAHRKKLSGSSKDVQFLIDTARSMDMPEFINKDLLIKRIDEDIKNDIDPCYFLEPIMQFCIWHRLFMESNHPNRAHPSP